jgi:hypothetical protein
MPKKPNPTPPHSWPGDEAFDDLDADDFEEDGTEDLPGVEEPRQARRATKPKRASKSNGARLR